MCSPALVLSQPAVSAHTVFAWSTITTVFSWHTNAHTRFYTHSERDFIASVIFIILVHNEECRILFRPGKIALPLPHPPFVPLLFIICRWLNKCTISGRSDWLVSPSVSVFICLSSLLHWNMCTQFEIIFNLNTKCMDISITIRCQQHWQSIWQHSYDS